MCRRLGRCGAAQGGQASVGPELTEVWGRQTADGVDGRVVRQGLRQSWAVFRLGPRLDVPEHSGDFRWVLEWCNFVEPSETASDLELESWEDFFGEKLR